MKENKMKDLIKHPLNIIFDYIAETAQIELLDESLIFARIDLEEEKIIEIRKCYSSVEQFCMSFQYAEPMLKNDKQLTEDVKIAFNTDEELFRQYGTMGTDVKKTSREIIYLFSPEVYENLNIYFNIGREENLKIINKFDYKAYAETDRLRKWCNRSKRTKKPRIRANCFNCKFYNQVADGIGKCENPNAYEFIEAHDKIVEGGFCCSEWEIK
jgi:hypothetical protein